MYFVHEDKAKDGRWQIAWMWMPHFLASDSSLHKFVSKAMTEEFRGTVIKDDEQPLLTTSLLVRMHKKVIDLVVEKYPITGLRDYLVAISGVQPEGKKLI